jgi:hypothetical protein
MVSVPHSASSVVNDLGHLDVLYQWHTPITAAEQVCEHLAIQHVLFERFCWRVCRTELSCASWDNFIEIEAALSRKLPIEIPHPIIKPAVLPQINHGG